MISNLESILSKSKALIVDDDEINREILGVYLDAHYSIYYASNGVEALELLKEHDDISIVLLDLLMPVMDGFEVIKRIKADKKIANIPIIVLTSETSYEIECLELGAIDFIKKPFEDKAIILARIRRVIEWQNDREIITSMDRDELTGLLNRNFFIQYAKKFSKTTPHLDFLSFDISHFSLLKEMNGKKFTDELLVELSKIIEQVFLPLGALLGREDDADAFYVITPPLKEYDTSAKTIKTYIEQKFPNIDIHIRVGLYLDIDDPEEVELALHRSITAADSMKDNSTLELVIYDDELHEKELFYQELINDFRKAIKEKQFVIYLQPKYAIQNGDPYLMGGEALVRWIHPKYGFVSPGQFIPLFEDNGLIRQLDEYVLTEAVHAIKMFKEKFGIELPISTNISRNDIYDLTLEDKIAGIVKKAGISTKLLHLEVTESAYSENSKQIIEVVNNFRNRGFIIEMDDFGSGYSNLNMLTTLPFDILKIDMGFIRSLDSDLRNREVIKLIIDIAKYLNCKTVAEGVETESHYLTLKELGCDIIQGYYFSKPLPLDQFMELIKKEQEKNDR